MIENKSVDELISMYDSLTYEQAEIWIPSTSYDNKELGSSILSNSNKDYVLKIRFYKTEDFRTTIFQNTKYQVIGYYENEEQLICVAENQQIYLAVKYDDLICYIAPNLKIFQQEILLFETLTKECELIDKISYTDENTEDILQVISDILKREILKIDSRASLKTYLVKQKSDRCGSCKKSFRRRTFVLQGSLTQQMLCIADFCKKRFLEMPSNAFDNIDNFWSEICIEIEDGIIFTY